MAATLMLVESDLIFGVPVLTGVVLQEIEANRDAKEAVATGEEGDEIGVAVYGGQMANCRGTYLFLGTDFGGGIGQNIASEVGTGLGLTGPILVSGFSRKRNHEAFADGSFKAVSLDGASVV